MPNGRGRLGRRQVLHDDDDSSHFFGGVQSVEGDQPHRAEIIFSPNEGKNYIASTITSRLQTQLREEVGNKFSEEYFKGIFDVIGDAGNGLSKAADGATRAV